MQSNDTKYPTTSSLVLALAFALALTVSAPRSARADIWGDLAGLVAGMTIDQIIDRTTMIRAETNAIRQQVVAKQQEVATAQASVQAKTAELNSVEDTLSSRRNKIATGIREQREQLNVSIEKQTAQVVKLQANVEKARTFVIEVRNVLRQRRMLKSKMDVAHRMSSVLDGQQITSEAWVKAFDQLLHDTQGSLTQEQTQMLTNIKTYLEQNPGPAQAPTSFRDQYELTMQQFESAVGDEFVEKMEVQVAELVSHIKYQYELAKWALAQSRRVETQYGAIAATL